MFSDDLASEFPLVILAGCLAVAVAVASLGLGLVNVMSAGSTEPMSSFGMARDALDAGTLSGGRPKAGEARFLDVGTFREKLTFLDDRSAALRREITALQRELAAERRAAALLDNPGAEPPAEELRRLLAEADRNWRERWRVRTAAVTLDLDAGGAPVQWIECVGPALILHPQETRLEAATLRLSSSTFLAALGREQIVLLIRPSGYSACEAARRALGARAIDARFEPVNEDWRFELNRRSP